MKYEIMKELWIKHHPDWLGDIPQVEFLYNAAMDAPTDSKFFVEIGTQYGESALMLTAAAEDKGQILYCIDPFDLHSQGQSQTELTFRKNMETVGLTNWILIRKLAEDAAPTFEFSIALLYIDGNHNYEYVLKDWELWAPKLIPGGVLIFHDRDCDGVSKVLNLVRQDQLFCNEKIGPDPLISFERKKN